MNTETLFNSVENEKFNQDINQALAIANSDRISELDTTKILDVSTVADVATREVIPPWKRRAVKALAVLAGTAAGIVGVGQYADGPEYSKEQVTEIATSGDTVWDMTTRSMEGVEDVNKQDAVREVYDRSPDLDDGMLNVGDEVNIPVSVK